MLLFQTTTIKAEAKTIVDEDGGFNIEITKLCYNIYTSEEIVFRAQDDSKIPSVTESENVRTYIFGTPSYQECIDDFEVTPAYINDEWRLINQKNRGRFLDLNITPQIDLESKFNTLVDDKSKDYHAVLVAYHRFNSFPTKYKNHFEFQYAPFIYNLFGSYNDLGEDYLINKVGSEELMSVLTLANYSNASDTFHIYSSDDFAYGSLSMSILANYSIFSTTNNSVLKDEDSNFIYYIHNYDFINDLLSYINVGWVPSNSYKAKIELNTSTPGKVMVKPLSDDSSAEGMYCMIYRSSSLDGYYEKLLSIPVWDETGGTSLINNKDELINGQTYYYKGIIEGSDTFSDIVSTTFVASSNEPISSTSTSSTDTSVIVNPKTGIEDVSLILVLFLIALIPGYVYMKKKSVIKEL